MRTESGLGKADWTESGNADCLGNLGKAYWMQTLIGPWDVELIGPWSVNEGAVRRGVDRANRRERWGLKLGMIATWDGYKVRELMIQWMMGTWAGEWWVRELLGMMGTWDWIILGTWDWIVLGRQSSPPRIGIERLYLDGALSVIVLRVEL